VPARPQRYLLDTARDHRAQPQRLRIRGPSAIAKDPPIDCFYVYPTVSTDRAMNSDLKVDRSETLATESQFARFASVCRPFAPIYRQMTVSAVAAYSAGADISQAVAVAYRDVAAAWDNYIRTRNQGRPFVLIGHSQGSLMLQMLIARRIETDPALAARMKLAIIPGFDLLVPEGRLVGGTFKKIPLCSHPGETGCAISWVSFREKNVPPKGAIFGYSDRPGMTVGCVNPARPGLDRLGAARQLFLRALAPAVPGGPVDWSSEGPPPTPYLALRRAGFGQMRQRRPARAICRSAPTIIQGDKRTDRVGGEVAGARHVPARLGHAPCRRARSAGRPHPRRRSDQSLDQNSCSTACLSAWRA
jgi:hypothetical protein